MIKIFKKGTHANLTKGLNLEEFDCKCKYTDCAYTFIDSSLLESYKKSREKFNRPLYINSGFRCQKHNADSNGVPNSKHTLGHAIDISFDEFDQYLKLELLEILRENFNVVLVYSTFFHCHNKIELG